MIKVIIFDLDGVLVDTKMIHYEALNLALEKFKFEFIKETFLRIEYFKVAPSIFKSLIFVLMIWLKE